MSSGLSPAQGLLALRLARHEVERAVGARGDALPAVDGLDEPRGAFVTLRRGDALRGCIGVPEPRDPRFEPVAARELPDLRVEVSVLTPPRRVDVAPRLLPDAIRVGEHGLLVEGPRARGLLLPQVAVEWGFTADQFLAAACRKAGLPDDAWRDEQSRLRWSVFGAQAFAETE